MKEESERSFGEDGTHFPNAHKPGLKSTHTVVVYTTPCGSQLMSGWQLYPPTTSAKPTLFEAIDLPIYQPSARCAVFCPTESRLLRWIRVFKGLAVMNRIPRQWRNGIQSRLEKTRSKCEKIVIHLFNTSSSSEQLGTSTVFVSTSRSLIREETENTMNGEQRNLEIILNKGLSVPSFVD